MGNFKGKVHFYDSKKKFGYVVDGYGNEYYFSGRDLKKGRQIIINTLDEDDIVEFDLDDGPKGRFATNVEIETPFPPHKRKFQKPENTVSTE